jgi:hypothetical protein
MRRFIITSPNYTGQAELIYNEKGLLVTFDFIKTSINNPTAILTFKTTVPVLVDDMNTAFANTKATIVEADFEISFDMFWDKYDKKINLKRCEPLWKKLGKTKQVKAYYGIEPYEAFLLQTGFRKKADPETYLRNEMWDNDWK